jgi:DNA-binding XRE family transcriptional regulator
VTIGDHLRKRRLDVGLLQRELAERLGVDETTVTNWELNRTAPALRFLPGIVRFLGYVLRAAENTLGERLLGFRRERGLSQSSVWPITRDRSGNAGPLGARESLARERVPRAA